MDREIVCWPENWTSALAEIVLKTPGKNRVMCLPTEREKKLFHASLLEQSCDASGRHPFKKISQNYFAFDECRYIHIATPDTFQVRGLHPDVLFVHWDAEHSRSIGEYLHGVAIPSIACGHDLQVYLSEIISLDVMGREKHAVVLRNPAWEKHQHEPVILRIHDLLKTPFDFPTLSAEQTSPEWVDTKRLETVRAALGHLKLIETSSAAETRSGDQT